MTKHIAAMTMKVGLLWLLVTPLCAQPSSYWAAAKREAARWEPAIQRFEAADRTNPPPQNAVLFLGSSSIRKWATLARDFPGHQVINRGFGGSYISDSVVFVNRIVIPYRPKVIVFYAGDNDIAAGKSPKRVFADFRTFVRKVHAALPTTRIGFIAIKPCPSRARFLPEVKKANRLISTFCRAHPLLTYLDIFTPSILANGKPRRDLYQRDMLHPNATGYALWVAVIRPWLDCADAPQPARTDVEKR